MARSQAFGFHTRCKNLHLTHLAYVDDLLLFSTGDVQSVGLLMSCILELIWWNLTFSWLVLGIKLWRRSFRLQVFQRDICLSDTFVFQLLQKKLRTSDYSLLVDAFKARIYLWPRHALSYAGKIELISVWHTKHPFISWRMLCKPKEDGGLGLKNLRAWNKALIAKTLWKINLN